MPFGSSHPFDDIRTELICSGVRLPTGVEPESDSSLNHACNLLSERYERQRISHTLKVYQQVFYRETDGANSRWYPLDGLRSGVIAGMERNIRADVWRKLEEQLGFRPVGKADTKHWRRGR